MPSKPKKPCSSPWCPNLTDRRYCQEHQHLERQYDRERGSAAKRMYDAKWRKAREQYLRENPWCVECQKHGKVEPATHVDHVLAHRGDQQLFWDQSNWAALCASHHSSKTNREDGGFGNPTRR